LHTKNSTNNLPKNITASTKTIDTTNISATYLDGVLQISMPMVAGKEATKNEIKIS
jgi:HSP20 family molecular chaperone IbpA